jgi:hypothetical protein
MSQAESQSLLTSSPTIGPKQAELGLKLPGSSEEIALFAERMKEKLRGRGWTPCDALLQMFNFELNEDGRRWIRKRANASGGEIASGQEGYKLVREMTAEEFNHFRNAMTRQAESMTRRVLEADKVFYGRKPVEVGNGVL